MLHAPQIFKVEAIHTTPSYFKVLTKDGDLILDLTAEQKDFLAEVFTGSTVMYKHIREAWKLTSDYASGQGEITPEQFEARMTTILFNKELMEAFKNIENSGK